MLDLKYLRSEFMRIYGNNAKSVFSFYRTYLCLSECVFCFNLPILVGLQKTNQNP
ncbi:MAG: hypothetical protein IJ515_06905 [Clostridia bacterium]|nr:hypothetical protein [Clostridia bacterium]